MADRWPLANGNWSNAANWNGGTLPDVGDDVYADGKTVTIDQDVTVLSIRNTQRSGGTANGGFSFSTAQTTYNITADLIGFNANLMTLNQTGRTYNFTGNIELATGATSSINCIVTSVADININVIGNINSTGNGQSRSGIRIANTGVVLDVIGNVNADGTTISVGITGIFITNQLSTITITGNLTVNGATFTTLVNDKFAALRISSFNQNITINGNVLANTANQFGVTVLFTSSATSNVSFTLNGIAQGAGSFSLVDGMCIYVQGSDHNIYIQEIRGSQTGLGAGVVNLTNNNVIAETLNYSNIGTSPVVGKVLFSATNFSLIGQDENSNTVIFTEDNNVGTFIPAEADVRLNTTYYDNNRVGSLAVPLPSDVRKSVPTDNTVGTADLTAQDFFDAIASSSDPIAIRLRNVATVETTGDQISAFNV
jgi:hypothetical protein